MAAEKQRKAIWVNSKIQGRIISRVAAYWFLYHLILWHTMFLVRYVMYRAAAITGDAEQMAFGEVYARFTKDFASVAVCAVVLSPIFLYDVLRNTHRIAGPLVRFQNALKRLIAGEKVDPIKLRKNDLLTDFQDSFNEFLEFYNSRLKNERKEQQASRRELMSAHDSAVIEQIEKLREKIGEKLGDSAIRQMTTR